MQKLMIASVLALAGLSLAGGVAADNGDDCTYGATPLPSGYYNACIFEENAGSYSYNYCSWSGCYEGSSTWAQNQLASVYLGQSASPLPVYASAGAHAGQYESSGWSRYSDRFGSGSSQWDNANTQVYAWNYVSMPFFGTGGSVNFYQYDDSGSGCNNWGCYSYDYEGTTISADRYIGPGGFNVGYQQYSNNGAPCQEQVYMYTSFGGYATPAQACTAEIPQLMQDPNTQFPDYPDGTGLPFL